MKAKRYIFLIVLATAAASTILVNQIQHRDAYSSDSIREQLTRFQEVFAIINNYYVEPPDREKLITGAINGMLSELDPHSVYIPKKNLERVTEQFEGSFEGIGIEFVILNKMLTVVSPIVGGPSEAVGIRPGDQIIRIEGVSTYGITEDEVLKKLRGPAGTQVKVTIRRPADGTEFDVVITRDKIPIYSVMAAFMLDQRTGYIYVGRFARTTSQEIEEALAKLEKQGMKQLVFDLRGNSGGYLDQAFEVADKFIPGGYKIVYTRGRIRNADQDFFSTDKGTHPLFPMVVLIDHGSASASEIVAGAIQDLDRGLVLGQTSFGKGLVQNQIPLSDGGALRLTVARYYTPSGRLIQRPYEEDNLLDYYNEAYSDSADARKPDSTKQYLTLAGRTVYGGGGITPDSILAPERITRFTNRLIVKRLFFEFAVEWAGRHKNAYKDFNTFDRDFVFDQNSLEEFKSLMKKQGIEFVEEAYRQDADYIALLVKAEIARQLWNSEHYYKVRISADREVEQAVRLMPEAERIKNLHDWKGMQN